MAALPRNKLPRELLAIIHRSAFAQHAIPPGHASRLLPRSTLQLPQAAFSTSWRRHDGPSKPRSQSSVDPTEISHFDALASSWWDQHGPSRLLHLMNPLRHTFIQSCLASEPAPSTEQQEPSGRKLRYLDIGCGGGIFAESAARLPDTASVTAIDPSAAVLAVAEAHRLRDPLLTQPGRLTYINTAIEDLAAHLGGGAASNPSPPSSSSAAEPLQEQLPAPGPQFDIVTLFEVLEHVASPSAFLRSAASFVRPGGWLVASTIARTPASWFITKFMAEHVLRLVPRGTHDWSKYIHERELRAWFAGQGGGSGWNSPRAVGVMYVPGLGWREVPFRGGESIGNYFFGIRKDG